jgi:hypothetical protein
MSQDELTTKAATLLSESVNPKREVQFDDEHSFKGDFDCLTVMDLSADGTFQELIEPKEFARILLKKGLPETVERICLLISDTQLKHSLAVFSKRLAVELENRGRYIKVNYVSELNAYYTLVVSPSNNKDNWKVYAIYDGSANKTLNVGCSSFFKQEKFVKGLLADKRLNIDAIESIKAKRLIWEGKDIEGWLNQPRKTALPHQAQKAGQKPTQA